MKKKKLIFSPVAGWITFVGLTFVVSPKTYGEITFRISLGVMAFLAIITWADDKERGKWVPFLIWSVTTTVLYGIWALTTWTAVTPMLRSPWVWGIILGILLLEVSSLDF